MSERPSVLTGLRRLLRGAGVVLLLVLVVAFVAVLVSLRLLADGADAEAIELARRWNEVVLVVVGVLGVVAVVLGWMVWQAVQRGVTAPLGTLAAEVRKASAGEHDHEIPRVGAGEVAALSRDVENMRRELVQQVAEAREAHAEAEDAQDRLQEQARELERSNRDLEQFAYVASHDLQEPLRKVASFTQLLQKRYGGQLDDRADQYIAFAVDGAHRMQRLIQDLLSFSRVGRSGVAHEDVDLESVLRQVLADLSQRIEDEGAEVTHDPLPVVRGEKGLLTMLLRNVVGNALKFRHPDRPPRVHVTARRGEDGASWELACSDNGIGIDPQYAERVFVIFQRLHPKEVYSGTGIGLALVKRVVEHHGGRVWIDPDATQGTTIRWTLAASA
ncbi:MULTISPECIES: sensor histidine kinase [Isoptericola]|uniref:sensor histidine kinase n=1 Tax=Isoptericola TaxID=254250 RepID=UPI000D0538CC|nr:MULTISPECIES: ATP-binding protein [Isoptericola]MCK0116628.1 ATP-binding protein [Isoptericola sp. S6320L]